MLTSDRIKAMLDRRGMRLILASVATLLARYQKQGVRKVFYDGEVWMHETAAGYFAYHQPFVRLDLRRMNEAARANFFWAYRPRVGDVVIDIGAGVGEEALSFSRAVGPKGKVVCMEAHPRTYRCLEKLVQYNDLANVVCVHRAISEFSGRTAMIADSDTYVGNRLSSAEGTPVRTITVDALHQQLGLGRVRFLKMNIEGAESLAIRGMRETVKQTEVLCISCHDFLAERTGDESLRTKNEVKGFLRESGIKILDRWGEKPYIRDQVWGFNEHILRDSGDRQLASAS